MERICYKTLEVCCGRGLRFPQQQKEASRDFLPTQVFGAPLMLMHTFRAIWWSCPTFLASKWQARRLSLQKSHTVTLLSCALVLECPGDPVERIPVWDHPELRELGHSMRVIICSCLLVARSSTNLSSFSFGWRS